MADVTVNRIRETFKRLSEAGTLITKPTLMSELGVTNSDDARRLKDALQQMIRKGEAVVSDSGVYLFVAEASPPTTLEEQWTRIYRAARVAKGCFDADHVSQVTVVQPPKARRDLETLVKRGYLTAIKTETGFRYSGTQLLRDSPEIPPMPRPDPGIKSTMRRAREAVAELNRLFLLMELDFAGSRKLIKAQLAVLNEEFK